MSRNKASPPTSVIETFCDPRGYSIDKLVHAKPYCFNGEVGIRRWRVTVEEIAEPKEILAERLRALWEAETNHHHYAPLMAVASRLGVELENDKFGAWNRTRRKT